MTAFLSLDKVTKRFKNDLVFEDVCLTAEPGQIVGLVGHNGCGKTVLFKCIVGLQKIQSGQIQIANQVIGRDVEIAQNVGILLEKPGFIRAEEVVEVGDFMLSPLAEVALRHGERVVVHQQDTIVDRCLFHS